MMRCLTTFAVLGVFFYCLSNEANALITGGAGNAPVRDNGWPTGALAVANDLSRVAWWEGPPFGGGEHHFDYAGDAADLNRILSAFAEIKTPKLELVIHDGVQESFWLRTQGLESKVNWTFTVWRPESWHRLYNNPRTQFASDQPNFRQPVAAPRIDAYVGGAIDWKDVVVPKGIQVSDQRASALGVMLDAGVLLRGTVYDMSDGKVIAGARVVVEKSIGRDKSELTAETTTGDDGTFILKDIPAETQRVYVEAAGFAPRKIAYERFQDKTIRTFDVQLVKAASIKGIVVKDDGEPLAGVTVQLMNPLAIDGRGYVATGRTEATTNEHGQFEMKDVPTGYAQLRCVTAEFYHHYMNDMYDMPGEDIKLKVMRTGTVNVKAVDAKGEPITSAFMVEIEPEGGNKIGSWGGSANVDAEGGYAFKGVPPGRYKITGRPNPGSSKYKPDVKWINVVGGDTIEVQVVHQ